MNHKEPGEPKDMKYRLCLCVPCVPLWLNEERAMTVVVALVSDALSGLADGLVNEFPGRCPGLMSRCAFGADY